MHMDRRDNKLILDTVRNAAPTRLVLIKSDDGKKMPTYQARSLDGEIMEDMEYFQPYGFTSRPRPGSEMIGFPVGGDRGHMVAVAASDRSLRKKDMQDDEVGIYHANGDFFYLKDGNEIETSTKKSTVNAADEATVNTREFAANASESAEINGGVSAQVKAPQIGLKGALTATGEDGGPTTARFHGDMYIEGNLHVTGHIIAGGNVTAGGDVVAGGVSLRGHAHAGVTPGGGNTGKPVSSL